MIKNYVFCSFLVHLPYKAGFLYDYTVLIGQHNIIELPFFISSDHIFGATLFSGERRRGKASSESSCCVFWKVNRTKKEQNGGFSRAVLARIVAKF